MGSLILALFVLGIGWQAYRNAKKSGNWSNKAFFIVLLAILALVALVTIPLQFISSATMDAHFGLVMTCILLAIGIGVTLIAIYCNRWWKRQLLKRSAKDETLPVRSAPGN